MAIWKAYVLALAGNWILAINEGAFSHKMNELDKILKSTGLRTSDDSASTVFSQIVNLVRRLAKPSAAEVAISWTPGGLPIIAPRVEFSDDAKTEVARIEHDHAPGVLDAVLKEVGYSVWLVLDRLDEAFRAFPKRRYLPSARS